MHLYLKLKMKELRQTDYEFFQTAYEWKFNKSFDPYNDVVQYRLHAIIPPYVAAYVRHLERTEK